MKNSPLLSLFVGLVMANGFDTMKGRAGAQSYEEEVMADNPFVYYRFNETDGTQATDSSGNNLHGSYVGGVALGQVSAADGLGTAALFDGESGYVQLAPLNFEADQFTIEAWLNLAPEGLDGSCCTSIFSPDGWEQGWVHYNLKGDANIEFALNSGGPNNHNTDPETVPFEEWVHIASVYDKDEALVRTYVNGEEVEVSPPDFGTPQTVKLTVDAQIGAWAGSRFFGGLMDEFAIYDSALSPARIRVHREGAATADLDDNGVVDVADFQILIGNFNTAGTSGQGDLDLDGFVGLADFLRFRTAFEMEQAVAVAVPEPVAGFLGRLAALAVLVQVRRRRR